MKTINSVLVANRGEIAIRVFRACNELGIRTIAIYSSEDTLSLHRSRADEAYLVGEGKGPIEAYLDIDDIIRIAKEHEVDAIHPGYGFLSENSVLAQRCAQEGIIFIGPHIEHLIMFGDKINAREQAKLAGIPMIPGSDGPVDSLSEVQEFAQTHGFPIIIKAIMGGGGRGMRVVNSAAELDDAYQRAKSEALTSFGNDAIYVEKLLIKPKHIEVQIIGDEHGNIVHLYERDCSVQRRHQKLVEMAPAFALPPQLRLNICQAAVKLMKNVAYVSVGTVEFLATSDGKFYFIEVNPRIQVEHTVTEMITGIDIVQTQIMIAAGHNMFAAPVCMPPQNEIACNGHAIQCRITTEDPANNFTPDTGKLIHYRSGGGFGIRLDGGNAYTGSVITPYYDSLLVKATTWGLTHDVVLAKMLRCLHEFRIRGVKTNIAFLENVLNNEQFRSGDFDTTFVDNTPQLFEFPKIIEQGTKMITYIAETTVNGYMNTGAVPKPEFRELKLPTAAPPVLLCGSKQVLDNQGPEGVIKWIKAQDKLLLTDTTMRDAHQSLFATRLRTKEILDVLEPTVQKLPNLFSLECWGGATFDVAYRFLYEDPWERLAQIRQKAPNILLQMLLRGANAVGYTNYPNNVVREFINQAAAGGVDVFRIFDSLNNLQSMTLSIETVRKNNRIAEVAMCYTGDILDKSRSKYDLNYYINLAKEIEQAGAHILAIKDMAGLLKPQAAYELISALKQAVDLPIHLHTHEAAGNAVYTCAKAAEAGVDIVDVAVAAMSGGTSQPSANSLYYALQGNPRQPAVNIDALDELSRYWEGIRPYYKDIDSTELFANTEVYKHEMPGGQYTNIKQQTEALGLISRWEEVKDMYRRVNILFGDIIKVTPSSKIVGDMALFMVQNDLTERDIYEKGSELSFPTSVVEFFQGKIGIPYQGFDKKLQEIILQGKPILTAEALPDVDFEAVKSELVPIMNSEPSKNDIISYCLYPKVFTDWVKIHEQYNNISALDAPTFFFGLSIGEKIRINTAPGKIHIVKLINIGPADDDGMRSVNFELNGMPREIIVKDKAVKITNLKRKKADKDIIGEIGATLSGTVVKILVTVGQAVEKGTPLAVTEAMKMETTIQAPKKGVIAQIHVKAGSRIDSGDCLLEIE